MTDAMRRIDEIAIDAGFQLTRPTRYIASWDVVRVDILGDLWMEFDAEMFGLPSEKWEPIVRLEADRLRKRAAQ
jgi:hypothetical protein